MSGRLGAPEVTMVVFAVQKQSHMYSRHSMPGVIGSSLSATM